MKRLLLMVAMMFTLTSCAPMLGITSEEEGKQLAIEIDKTDRLDAGEWFIAYTKMVCSPSELSGKEWDWMYQTNVFVENSGEGEEPLSIITNLDEIKKLKVDKVKLEAFKVKCIDEWKKGFEMTEYSPEAQG